MHTVPGRPRLLFVTQKLPYPLTDGGNIRSFKILEALADVFEITLIGASSANIDLNDPSHPLRVLCRDVVSVSDTTPGFVRSSLRVSSGLAFRLKPAPIGYNYNFRIQKAVGAALEREKYEVIHLNHADAGQYVRFPVSTQCVIDTHNILFDFHAKAAAVVTSPWRKLLHRLVAQQMLAYERVLFRSCNLIVVCSKTERDRLRPLEVHSPIAVIPNGVDRSYFRADDVDYFRNPPSVVFTGNMAYGPNRDGALFFVREVLPLVRREYPELRVLIVGKHAGTELMRLPQTYSGVIVTGAVEDVRTYMRQARVFVAPLRIGSGTRLKLLEAFSMGIPAVATTLAAEGLDCVDGEHVLLADDESSMARQVCRLVSDHDLHRTLSRNARQLAETAYDWSTIGRRLVEVYPVRPGNENNRLQEIKHEGQRKHSDDF